MSGQNQAFNQARITLSCTFALGLVYQIILLPIFVLPCDQDVLSKIYTCLKYFKHTSSFISKVYGSVFFDPFNFKRGTVCHRVTSQPDPSEKNAVCTITDKIYVQVFNCKLLLSKPCSTYNVAFQFTCDYYF